MQPTLACNYIACSSPISVACSCSPNQVLLCQSHAFQHIKDQPSNTHNFQDLYLPLEPHEKAAFLSIQTYLLHAARVQRDQLTTEHSLNSEKTLKELATTTQRMLQELKDRNRTHLKGLRELYQHMHEMKAALTELVDQGIPTFRQGGFSARLKALKRNNQVFTYSDILREAKTYWEQRGGMSPLSQLTLKDRTQDTEQAHFTEIRKHQIGGSGLSFAPNGRYYAAGDNSIIKIWDSTSGEALHSFVGHSAQVLSVSFSPDSEFLVSGSADKTIRVWRAPNGPEINELRGHCGPVHSAVVSHNGEYIGSGSADTSVKLWRVGGEQVHSFKGHLREVYSVSFSQDDRLLASGSYDCSIRIWDLSARKLRRTLSSHLSVVESVCFARANSLLVSGSLDKTVKLWNVESGEVVHTFQTQSPVFSVVFSPNNEFVASGGGDTTIKLWRIPTRALAATLQEHCCRVVNVVFSPDSLILASRDSSSRLNLVTFVVPS